MHHSLLKMHIPAVFFSLLFRWLKALYFFFLIDCFNYIEFRFFAMSFSKLSVFFISKLHLSYFCQIIPKLFRRFEAYFCYYFVEGFSVSYLYYIHRILVRLFPNYSDDLIGFYVTPPSQKKKQTTTTKHPSIIPLFKIDWEQINPGYRLKPRDTHLSFIITEMQDLQSCLNQML